MLNNKKRHSLSKTWSKNIDPIIIENRERTAVSIEGGICLKLAEELDVTDPASELGQI